MNFPYAALSAAVKLALDAFQFAASERASGNPFASTRKKLTRFCDG